MQIIKVEKVLHDVGTAESVLEKKGYVLASFLDIEVPSIT